MLFLFRKERIIIKIIERCIYKKNNNWILILYSISNNHYVGLPVYKNEKNNSYKLNTINKYVILEEVNDFSRKDLNSLIYIKGKPLRIEYEEYNNLLVALKKHFLNYISDKTDNSINGIKYNKWCKDKLNLINKEYNNDKLRVGAIFWVDLGYNIGSELCKLRPAILWRNSGDFNMWTIIPLTSKHFKDKFYFHYDLDYGTLGTTRIENLINISSKRIMEPYFICNRIAQITNEDKNRILSIIKKYYSFEL